MYIDENIIDDLYVQLQHAFNRSVYSNWEIGTDKLKYHNLIFLYEGEGIFTCNNLSHKISAPSLIYFPQGCKQHISTIKDKPLRFYTVNFYAALPKIVINTDTKTHEWKIFNAEFSFPFTKTLNDASVMLLFRDMYERLCRIHLTGKTHTKDVFKRMQTLLNLISLAYSTFTGYISQSSREKVNCVVQYILEHYNENISLSLLAHIIDVSEVYLIKLFKQVTNKSPIDYLISVRITKAKQLLNEVNSISFVAKSVGFSDIYYFSNTFKKHEGISPSKYKKKNE